MNSGPGPFDRPLDALLERLRRHATTPPAYRAHRVRLDLWHDAVCPVCDERTLAVVETKVGDAVATCSNECDRDEIVRELRSDPRIRQALAVADDARRVAARAVELAVRLDRELASSTLAAA